MSGYKTNYQTAHNFQRDINGLRLKLQVYGAKFSLKVHSKTDEKIGVALIFVPREYDVQGTRIKKEKGKRDHRWGPAVPSGPPSSGGDTGTSLLGGMISITLDVPLVEKFGGAKKDPDLKKLGIATYRYMEIKPGKKDLQDGYKDGITVSDTPGVFFGHSEGRRGHEGEIIEYDVYWTVLRRESDRHPWKPAAVLRLKSYSGPAVSARHVEEGVELGERDSSGVIALPGMDLFNSVGKYASTDLDYSNAEPFTAPTSDTNAVWNSVNKAYDAKYK